MRRRVIVVGLSVCVCVATHTLYDAKQTPSSLLPSNDILTQFAVATHTLGERWACPSLVPRPEVL